MLRCVWCGWEGKKSELDMDEHDNPRWCPGCGSQQFTKFLRKERVRNNEPKLGKTLRHQKPSMGR